MSKTLAELIEQSRDAGYFRHSIKNLSDEQRCLTETIALELDAAGAAEPLAWAYSEAREGIPQRARFYFLREFSRLSSDVAGNVDAAANFDEGAEQLYREICDAIGQEKVDGFLKAYGKGLLNTGLNIIDEENSGVESVGWLLIETDGEGQPTGRCVGGLHEDWLEFDS